MPRDFVRHPNTQKNRQGVGYRRLLSSLGNKTVAGSDRSCISSTLRTSSQVGMAKSFSCDTIKDARPRGRRNSTSTISSGVYLYTFGSRLTHEVPPCQMTAKTQGQRNRPKPTLLVCSVFLKSSKLILLSTKAGAADTEETA
jgi:hypothetical protein